MAPSKKTTSFNIEKYLETAGARRKVVAYRKGQRIFSQGDTCASVHYIQSGTVKISVNSSHGKEAVIAPLRQGDFFGEGCVAGQELRVATATAMEEALVLEIEKKEMIG